VITSKNFIVTEHGAAGPVKYHTFTLPTVGEPGFYRSTVSFNSFFYGRRGRNHNGQQWFYGQRIEEMLYKVEGLEILAHDSIWDFYKAIKFDYKKSKYHNETPT
jgi:hypothetical protein